MEQEFTICRNGSAKCDPSIFGQASEAEVQDLSTDCRQTSDCHLISGWWMHTIVKVDIQVADCLHELLLEVGALVVQRRVNAYLIYQPFAFVVGPSNGDHFGTHYLANLADDGASGTGCTRDDECLASLELTDLDETLCIIPLVTLH